MAKWSSDNRAPAADAVWTERVRGSDGGLGLGQVRHPGHAWIDTLAQVGPMDAIDPPLKRAAGRYLAALAKLLPELASVAAGLQRGDGALSWLPVAWGLADSAPDSADPDASFLLTRGEPDAWREASLVLLAARCWQGRAIGDAVGLRLTAGVTRAGPGKPWHLRFSSLNCSRLALAGASAAVDARLFEPAIQARLQHALQASQVRVRAAHATADADVCHLHGVALRAPMPARRGAGHGPVWAFAVQLNLRTLALRTLRLRPWSSSAQALRLFERDPASMGEADSIEQRRPGLDTARLDPLREFLKTPAQWPSQTPSSGQAARLVVARLGPQKRQTLVGDPNLLGPMRPVKLPRVGAHDRDPFDYLPLRSDALADAQASLRGQSLFDRLDAYGLATAQYFRHAALPLTIWPRAALRGAADGHSLNAEVFPVAADAATGFERRLDAQPPSTPAHPLDPGQRPHLVVALGSADISSHQGQETLGLAADPRWIWHEFCHVLNFAATGELEFAFAHSAGDALAAITADPDSCLAADPALRGSTFPWAYTPRRHDRLASQGYGWCGARNALRLEPNPAPTHYQHGYFEEQLLSSSLFRLYRCLGGDTGALPAAGALTAEQTAEQTADLGCRQSASDYCVYLLMRAIALLGPNTVVPARSVDQFVTALIDADLATGQWLVDAPWPYRDHRRRQVRRQGGQVHKVIRWAFEQQGLYATDDPEAVVEGLGLPPPVDAYIADRRDGPPGAYTPVPLRWDSLGQAAWNASAQALQRGADGGISISIGQRGLRQPDDLGLRLWACADLGAGAAPRWQLLPTQPEAEPGRFSAGLAGSGLGPDQPLWLLASADTRVDPSNLAPDARPPTDPAALIELVAHDNNLALGYLA